VSEDTRHDTRTGPVDPAVADDERRAAQHEERRAVDYPDTEGRGRETVADEPVATDVAGTQRHIPRDPTSERVEPAASSGPGARTEWSAHTGLLPDNDLAGFQQRWNEIQARFIDEPRESVRQADDLVSDITRQIAERFTTSRKEFEQRWESDDQPTTEELRQALQRLRDFFQRLVAH
jgi:hypothetical protein